MKTRVFWVLACPTAAALLLLILGLPASADEVILPDGTPITVRLKETLRSGLQKVGETFDVETSESIRGRGGVVVIRAGALGRGTITVSKKSRFGGKAGKLDFTVDFVEAVDGTRVPTRAHFSESGQGQGSLAVLGAVFVALPLLFVKGSNVTLPKGFELTVYVNGDHKIEVPSSEESNEKAVQPLDVGPPKVFAAEEKSALVVLKIRNPNEKLGLRNAHISIVGLSANGDLAASNSSLTAGDPRQTLFSLAPNESCFFVKEVSVFGAADRYLVHVSEALTQWDRNQGPDVQVLSSALTSSGHLEGIVANRSNRPALVEIAAVGLRGDVVKACGVCILKTVAAGQESKFKIKMFGAPEPDLNVICTASGVWTDTGGSQGARR